MRSAGSNNNEDNEFFISNVNGAKKTKRKKRSKNEKNPLKD
jgi:hypothetical protein